MNNDFLLINMISPNCTFIPESKPNNCRASLEANDNTTTSSCHKWYQLIQLDRRLFFVGVFVADGLFS
jgi:hypothetical protein